MGFYLLGLLVVLLLKIFIHNRIDSPLEWIKRVIETPSDACIFSLLTVVAATATSGNAENNLSYDILQMFVLVVASVVLYKYGSARITDQSGQVQFDSVTKFVVTFLSNIGLATFSIFRIGSLGVI